MRTILSLKNSKTGRPKILYYHRICDRKEDFFPVPDLAVSKNNFEKQMEFIKEEFNVLPLDVIVDRFKKGKALSYRDIAITFDDGYIDNYTYAFPILKRYGLPATIFLPTGYIGSDRLFWWDKLALILKAARSKEIEWKTFPLNLFSFKLKSLLRKTVSRETSLTPLTNYLKGIGTKRREEAIEYLEEKLLNGACFSLPPRLFLSWKEIKEMSGNGIAFGSHSHSHAILTEINDDVMVQELIFSKEIIKENIGTEVKAFSYPDGCVDYRVKRKVIEAGYDYAVKTNRYVTQDILDIYLIPRKMVKECHSKGYFNEFSKAMFTMELSGMYNHLLLRDSRRRNPYKC